MAIKKVVGLAGPLAVAGLTSGLSLGMVGCGAQPADGSLPDDALSSNADFLAVHRARPQAVGVAAQALGAEAARVLDSGDYAYLAVKKSLLGTRWFLTGTMKQFYPGNVETFSNRALGTRVVSFKVQNDKFYVLDASEQFQASRVENPSVLVEAYPLVRLPAFEALPGASNYVLVDPGAGLNRFSITGDTYADPLLSDQGSTPIRVGLSFMQRFRALPDGAAFEQVFVGDALLDGEREISAWGTLGVTLRRYHVGSGYSATPDPGAAFFFESDQRLAPDRGEREHSATRWNFRAGQPPLEVFIGAGALRAQRDFPDVDVLGAFARGVESWNDAFGFEALTAVQVRDDLVRDDDKTFVLVDYPGSGADFSFAQFHDNPNNGEILGGSVYFSGSFFDYLRLLQDGGAAVPDAAAAGIRGYGMVWGGLPQRKPACAFSSERFAGALLAAKRAAPADSAQAGTTAQQSARVIQYVVAHEVGHLLGLRHNFKGSLRPPSSSLMDYLDPLAEGAAQAEPGAYDRAALRYLYGLSTALPGEPFCSDEDTLHDPECTPYDAGADPLHDYWTPLYSAVAAAVLDGELPVAALDLAGLNEILGYARAAADETQITATARVDALALALTATRAAFSPAGVGPEVAARLNDASEYVLRRIALDPADARGAITRSITDATALAYLSDEIAKIVVNEDGLRSQPLRRTAVDALRGLQDQSALLALRACRDALREQLARGAVTDVTGVALTEELVARIEERLAPYFD